NTEIFSTYVFPLGVSTTVTVKSTDAHGNTASGAFAVKVQDITPPTTSASPSGAAGSNGWYTSPVTVGLSATDSASGVAATHYTVDGGPEQTGTAVALTADGVHTILYWSADNAGNAEAAK